MAESCRGASGIQTKLFRVICSNVKTFCVCIPEGTLGADLAGQYITFYSAGNATEYYVWFNNDVAADPAPGGTGIAIAITDTDVPATIAAAVAAAVNAEADFCSLQLDSNKSCFVIKTVDELPTNDPVSSDLTLLDPFVESEGFQTDLGLTGGGGFDISLNTETQETTCDQTGALVVSETITSVTPELEVTFKECNTALLKKIFGEGLGNVCEIDGAEYLGAGTASVGKNTATLANRISLCPVDADPAVDRSGWITFMLAFPTLDTFSYPSEESASIVVTFRGLVDTFAKDAGCNILHFGDPRVL